MENTAVLAELGITEAQLASLQKSFKKAQEKAEKQATKYEEKYPFVVPGSLSVGDNHGWTVRVVCPMCKAEHTRYTSDLHTYTGCKNCLTEIRKSKKALLAKAMEAIREGKITL